MRIGQRLIPVLGAALLFSACSQETTDDGYGSASVAALTSSDVDRVEVTIDGTGFAETLSRDPVSGNFEPVVISDIPIGSYTFRAQAYDDTTTPGTPILLYTGTAPATITEGVQTAVTILLQQVPPADPFVNTVPIFQSLVYTPANPRTDEVVTLTVSVLDPDVPPDVVTLAWSDTVGGLTPPLDQPSVDWTAPSTDGTYPVTITASDLSGATSTLTVNLAVSLRLGSSEVSIDLNTWPEVSGLVPDPTRIDVGETISLTLTATDPDGDDLAYAWSASGCAGIFSDATATPDFTLTDAQGGTECTLSVTVTDVDTITALPRGGSNNANVTIAIGPEVVPNSPVTSTCPCWNGTTVGGGLTLPTSVEAYWAEAASLGVLCNNPDTCVEQADYSAAICIGNGNPIQSTWATSVGDRPGLEDQSCAVYVEGTLVTTDQQETAPTSLIIPALTPAEYDTCLAEHRAFVPLAVGDPQDDFCGLPTP